MTVVLDDVRKRFSRGGAWVLDGIDLRVDPGTITVVVGTNGAGKSTLLRIISGLILATSGRVDGRPATIGYAPDRLGSRSRMSARDYVAHMARLRGGDRSATTRATQLFDRLGLQPGPDAPLRSLSKGNSQKVALVQALIAPVELLVLDEPFGGLDVPAREAVAEIVAERARAGCAVLVSAHQPLETITATRTLRLERGRLVADDAPSPTRVRVVVARRTGGESTVLAEAAAVDDLLRSALADGWSIRSVTPLTDPRAGGA